MRKLLTILFLFFSFASIGQSVVVRTTGTTTPEDVNLFTGRSFRVPAFADTSAANASIPQLDSAGKIIYTYDINGLWLRQNDPKKWTQIGSGSAPIKDTIYTQLPLYSFYNSNGKQVLGIQRADGIISGGIVTWSGNGLTYLVTPCIYQIGGVIYQSPQTTITLPAADPTYSRQDVFIVDTNNVATYLEGTPSASPTAPQVNASQLALTTGITLNPGDTIPSEIVATLIYDEGLNLPDEWDGVAQNTISANFTDASNPYHGSKDIYVSSYQSGAQIYFSAGAEQTFHNGDIINFHIYTNGTFNNTLYGYFADSDKLVTNYLHINSTYGFNPNNGNTYQNISIPLSAFQWTNNGQYKIFELELAGNDTTGTAGFFMDYFTIQQGIPNIPPSTGSDSVHGFIQAPDSSYLGVRRENGLVDTLEVLNTGAYGAVSSVGLSMPDVIFNSTVTNSPITTQGILTPTLKTQLAKTVLGTLTATTPSFINLDTSFITGIHTQDYFDTRYARIANYGQWLINGNDVYRYGKVGIGTDTASSKFTVTTNNLGSYSPSVNDTFGIRLNNNQLATVSVQQDPPSISFRGNGFNQSNLISNPIQGAVKFAITSGGAPTGQFEFWVQNITAGSYLKAASIGYQTASISGVSFSGANISTAGSISSGVISAGVNVYAGSGDGLISKNGIPPTSGSTQANSPRLRFKGAAWNGSNAIDANWIVENIVFPASTITSSLRFSSQIDVASYVQRLSITDDGRVSIGTSDADASAKFQVSSTTKGSIPFPVMTSTQRLAISSPSIGLHVYQSDGTEGVYVYKSTGWTFAY